LRTGCGLTRSPNSILAGQKLGADESTYRPGSVVRTSRSGRATIHLRLPLPTASSGLPAGSGGPPSNACAVASNRNPPRPFDLAPGGVYRAARVTSHAGGLLHHRFTLTPPDADQWATSGEAVCFLWHCPAGHPGWALPTTLPCGARTFLGAHPNEFGYATRSPGRLVRRATTVWPRATCRHDAAAAKAPVDSRIAARSR
jgi:hypothetical protein